MIQGLGPKTQQAHQATTVNLSDLQQALQMVAGYGFVDVSPDTQSGRIKVVANLDKAQLARAKEVIEQMAPFVFGNAPIPDFEFVSLSGAPLASAASSGAKLAFVDSFQNAASGSLSEAGHAVTVIDPTTQTASARDAAQIGKLGTES